MEIDSLEVHNIPPSRKKVIKISSNGMVSPRAKCGHCRRVIAKGTRRIRKTKYHFMSRKNFVKYYHLDCYIRFIDSDTNTKQTLVVMP